VGAVRAPAVSGRFYPGTKGELERAVRELLRTVEPGAHPAAARAAIAPHAGYLYSGLTAAHVFARLRLPRLIVIVAPNHTGMCRASGGASLWETGAFATPLGEVPIDDAFTDGENEVTRWTVTGTHEGELAGIPRTGRRFSVTGISIGRVVNGKITESWNSWDALGLMQQLGVVSEAKGRAA